ncbi:hypothetical protein LSH36_1340g00027 [Paralvinella palmiformis]|uniref:EGF-like domain-containing protein n=1 Tax=Paralvinella palmiformis TaxID=53620 RepID=A0AAD9ITB3_9ANNE|nr:hypothetical protein LSH36_1340g00027 [Paralvinella palmiformis]
MVLRVLTKETVSLVRAPMATRATPCGIEIDECQIQKCSSHGKCEDGIAGYNCFCDPGYSGKDSENDPCLNGGTCENKKVDFICKCEDGYTGKTCGIETDECASSPCQKGGTCYDGINKFTCICTNGYEGDTCNTGDIWIAESVGVFKYFDPILSDIDECSPNPCLNGAYCSELVNDFECNCTNGYAGKTSGTGKFFSSDIGSLLVKKDKCF